MDATPETTTPSPTESAPRRKRRVGKKRLRRIMNGCLAACADLDVAVQDMLRAPRSRELGPVLHRKSYNEARKELLRLIALALPPEDETT
jgi:hypothetical protein